jgi:hypothetical protein
MDLPTVHEALLVASTSLASLHRQSDPSTALAISKIRLSMSVFLGCIVAERSSSAIEHGSLIPVIDCAIWFNTYAERPTK